MTSSQNDPDAWQRGYEGKLADIEQRNERMRDELENVEVTERSGDITVTVNSQGNLTGLTLGNALRQRGGDEVAREVLRLISVAQSQIADRVREIMEPSLGDSEAMDFVLGKVRSATEPPAEQPRPARPRSEDWDDDDFGNNSFLR